MMTVSMVVVAGEGCTDETGTNNSHDCEPWVDGLNWSTVPVISGHAARKGEAGGEGETEKFEFVHADIN